MIPDPRQVLGRIFPWNQEFQNVLRSCSILTAASTRNPLVVVLKTKNDSTLLRKWIEHYEALVGCENIIILDDTSTNSAVLHTYRDYCSKITIIQYDSAAMPFAHNACNDCNGPFEPLYHYMNQKWTFFVILDTDEFLYLYESDDGRVERFSTDRHRLCDFFLDKSTKERVIFTMWLLQKSFTFEEKIFHLAQDQRIPQFTHGKPILSTAYRKSLGTPFILHNLHLPHCLRDWTPTPIVPKLFLLHFNNIPLQRIKVNLAKIRNHLQRPNLCLKDVVSDDTIFADDGSPAAFFIRQTKNMIISQSASRSQPIDDGKPFFVLNEKDGSVTVVNAPTDDSSSTLLPFQRYVSSFEWKSLQA